MPKIRKTYWWKARQNAGDRLSAWILYRLGEQPAWREPGDADLVLIGSVLEHLPKGFSGTICGAGLLRPNVRIDLTKANVLALRGHLTAKAADYVGEPVLGDPGLLVSRFVGPSVAKYDLGVVPHWSDTDLAKRFPYARLIDPNILGPEEFVRAISECKRIVSSSLHGLVVADAYGIPRQAELFAQAATEGGDFKFRDYASVFGTHPHFGAMWRAPHDAVKRIQDDLWRALMEALGAPVPFEHRRHRRHGCRRPQISFLVPFRDDGEHRTRTWEWLHRFWRHHFPDAEIIVGHCRDGVFNKCAAVNDAASRASGRVFVVCDADALMDPAVVRDAANRIDRAVRRGKRLWVMPYTHLFRLNRDVTLDVLDTDPRAPYSLPSPPPDSWLDGGSTYVGHLYGAMMQIVPREAFFMVRGWDERLAGWGGDDFCELAALDTLYAPHELLPADILHLWHSRIGHDWRTRRWVGQHGQANSRLIQRYANAVGEPAFMRGIVDEHSAPVELRQPWHARFHEWLWS